MIMLVFIYLKKKTAQQKLFFRETIIILKTVAAIILTQLLNPARPAKERTKSPVGETLSL